MQTGLEQAKLMVRDLRIARQALERAMTELQTYGAPARTQAIAEAIAVVSREGEELAKAYDLAREWED